MIDKAFVLVSDKNLSLSFYFYAILCLITAMTITKPIPNRQILYYCYSILLMLMILPSS